MRNSILNMALAITAGLIEGSVSVKAADKPQSPPVVVNTVALAPIGNGSVIWVAVGNTVKRCGEVSPSERTYPTVPEVRCIYAK